MIGGGRVLLVAHNAQFDLLFTAEMLRRHGNGGPEALKAADYLDSLTVYKDRRAYPHKLANAILTYKLEDKVQNSHRAIETWRHCLRCARPWTRNAPIFSVM